MSIYRPRVCANDDCGERVYSRGFCENHYRLGLRQKTTTAPEIGSPFTYDEDCRIIKMMDDCVKQADIAEALGRSTLSLKSHIKTMRRLGLLPEKSKVRQMGVSELDVAGADRLELSRTVRESLGFIDALREFHPDKEVRLRKV